MALIAPLATLSDYLLNGYWLAPSARTGNPYPPHHFDHTDLTYSTSLITGPNAEAHRVLIREALQHWSEVCGVTFTEVTMGGNLAFINNYTKGLAASPSIWEATLGQPLRYVGATITINEAEAVRLGFGFGSQTYEAYVHEIGHALGLGHLGPYNNGVPDNYKPSYAADRVFDNDTEQYSVMSYFDESNFGGATGGANPLPQMADILAVQTLYGPGIARPGDTVYGRGGNAGTLIDRTALASGTTSVPLSFTLVDSGGTDTIDVSDRGNDQRVDLAPGAWSSIGGGINNLGIWLGTVIENARTGAGRDTLIGNDAANQLDGGAGADTLRGGIGNDTLTGGAGADLIDGGPGSDTVSYASATASVTVFLDMHQGVSGDAAGDTLTGIENLVGGLFSDGLVGDAGPNLLSGGAGNDQLTGGAGADVLIGGPDEDTADYSDEAVGVAVDLGQMIQHGGAAEGDWLLEIEHVLGSRGPDRLTGSGAANRLRGHFGNDTLDGGEGRDRLEGGSGDDLYRLHDISWDPFDGYRFDTVTELAGGGVDRVEVQASSAGTATLRSYTLPAEVENGTVTSAIGFQLTGNALANALTGHDGGDVLSGGAGADVIKGGGGADRLDGGSEADLLFGDAGADTLKGGGGADQLDGGGDVDLAAYDASPGAVEVSLATGRGHGGDAEGDTLTGIEGLFGSRGNDTLTGDLDANLLRGAEGSDVLTGGPGNDTLTGGPQADRFVWSSGDGQDVIEDFDAAAGDRIDLRGAAGVRSLGDMALVATAAGTLVSVPGGGLLLKNVGPGSLGAAPFLLSTAPTDPALSASRVAENSARGTAVGTLSATDPDPGEVLTFSLLDDAQGRFAVQGNQLVVAGAIDYETAAAHSVTVHVSDRAGLAVDKRFTIAVTNVVETRNGSAGNDTLTVDAATYVERVDAGAGNDTITIAAGLGPVVVDAGTGNDVVNGNGQTVLSFASAASGVNFNFAGGAGQRQAVLKNLDTGVVTPLQTRSGARDPQDFGASDNPVFSPDGTRVAFQSTAPLDPAQPGGSWQVWVKDLVSGTTSLVSSSAAGAAGNGNSLTPDQRVAWSPDGTRIAFTSSATNLVAGDTNGLADLFVKTVSGPDAGRIERVSVATGGAQAGDAGIANTAVPHGSFAPQFSPDGRLLLFGSSADNLAAGDRNGATDLFVRVLSGTGAGSTFLVTRNAAGASANGASLDASFSPDGTRIVFRSAASDFGSTGNGLFLKDIRAVYAGQDPAAGALTPVATTGFWPSFSPDGRQVLFHNGQIQTVDLVTGATRVVSSSAAGTPGNGVSQMAAWSRDGQSVVFASAASNLVAGDTNGAIDVFVKTVAGPNAGAIVRASADAAGVQGNAGSLFPLLSPANAHVVAFETDANNLFVPATGVGNDRFSGVQGVWGSPFNDILVNSNAALAGASFRGGAGSDVIQGHAATRDEADYRDSPAGITLAMTNDPALPGYGSARDGWGGTDTLRSIDAVQGSAFDDVIRLDGLANLVRGHGGADVLEGRGGDDLLDGGDGIDTAVYAGRMADYALSAGGTLQGEAVEWTLQDRRAGAPDGRDGLEGIERLQFADATVDLGNPQALAGLVGLATGG
ncbi:MAG: M10 family metallopeptidase C-terminal domain-containing protein [Rubrivivax sp.]